MSPMLVGPSLTYSREENINIPSINRSNDANSQTSVIYGLIWHVLHHQQSSVFYDNSKYLSLDS